VDTGLAQHSVVLDFGSSESWGVGAQDDEFALGSSELSEGLSVAKAVFTRLHDQLKSGVDGLGGVSFLRHVLPLFFVSLQLKWKRTRFWKELSLHPVKRRFREVRFLESEQTSEA